MVRPFRKYLGCLELGDAMEDKAQFSAEAETSLPAQSLLQPRADLLPICLFVYREKSCPSQQKKP